LSGRSNAEAILQNHRILFVCQHDGSSCARGLPRIRLCKTSPGSANRQPYRQPVTASHNSWPWSGLLPEKEALPFVLAPVPLRDHVIGAAGGKKNCNGDE
jgi:hypothetical protein